jgi:CTP:molybdopterin cytidylyltransferase MocA
VRIAAIVLAAGEGRRMGGPKALLPIDDTTFLARACRLFLDAALADVIAVLGAEAERVKREARLPDGVCVVVNEAWQSGMLSSIWRGLDMAEAVGAEGLLVHPVDNPFVSGKTIASVASALSAGARIAVPCHAARRGHPAGFSRTAWGELRAAPPERGARQVLASHPGWVVDVETGPDCLIDVDTPADLDSGRWQR